MQSFQAMIFSSLFSVVGPHLRPLSVVIGQRQKAPNFSAFHWSLHGSLVSIGQHFVTTRVVHLPKRTETSLTTESDQSGPNHQLLQLCTARTAWSDSDLGRQPVRRHSDKQNLVFSPGGHTKHRRESNTRMVPGSIRTRLCGPCIAAIAALAINGFIGYMFLENVYGLLPILYMVFPDTQFGSFYPQNLVPDPQKLFIYLWIHICLDFWFKGKYYRYFGSSFNLFKTTNP